jgi:hypothetical protein
VEDLSSRSLGQAVNHIERRTRPTRVVSVSGEPVLGERQMSLRNREIARLVGDPIPERLKVADLLRALLKLLDPGGSGRVGRAIVSSPYCDLCWEVTARG